MPAGLLDCRSLSWLLPVCYVNRVYHRLPSHGGAPLNAAAGAWRERKATDVSTPPSEKGSHSLGGRLCSTGVSLPEGGRPHCREISQSCVHFVHTNICSMHRPFPGGRAERRPGTLPLCPPRPFRRAGVVIAVRKCVAFVLPASLDASELSVGTDVKIVRDVYNICAGASATGRVLGALGRPADGGPALSASASGVRETPLIQRVRTVDERKKIRRNLHTGVKLVDLIAPLGCGVCVRWRVRARRVRVRVSVCACALGRGLHSWGRAGQRVTVERPGVKPPQQVVHSGAA